jgi:hypothetical protein
MIDAFEFVDAGRTFTCSVEMARVTPPEAWWWFRVSTESSQRHAPFKPAPGDTRQAVQQRIVTYYDDLLARRAQPATHYWRRAKPADGATPTGEVPAAIVAAAAD